MNQRMCLVCLLGVYERTGIREAFKVLYCEFGISIHFEKSIFLLAIGNFNFCSRLEEDCVRGELVFAITNASALGSPD